MGACNAASQQPLTLADCSAASIPFPHIPGAQVNHIEAHLVRDYSAFLPTGLYFGHEAWNVTGLDFCNVTVTYAHTGYDDDTNVQVWLPTQRWNERMVAVGGGGWATGLMELSYMTMAGALDEGYSAVSTDGGHDPSDRSPDRWALTKSGEINQRLLENFAHVALNDAAIVGKAVTKSFFRKAPVYSYWSGCSTGGRQGHILAQRYPTAFDGIFAVAPAINWPKFLPSLLWPQAVMNDGKRYPHPSELNAIKNAAVTACDADDGVTDGVISNPSTCAFSPFELVGQVIGHLPNGQEIVISPEAAAAATAAWSGPRSQDNTFLWYGIAPDAELAGPYHIASTNCSRDGQCKGQPFFIADDWVRYYLQRDRSWSFDSVGRRDFEGLFKQSFEQYESLLGSNNPDLSNFRDAGGKMITFHGVADPLIPVEGSKHYYERVIAQDPAVADYFRYFEGPGVGHCAGGPGPYPTRSWQSLVDWVEEGKAPDILEAVSEPNAQVEVFHRPICAYPKVARHDGMSDPHRASSFYCAESHLSATPILTTLRKWRQSISDYLGIYG